MKHIHEIQVTLTDEHQEVIESEIVEIVKYLNDKYDCNATILKGSNISKAWQSEPIPLVKIVELNNRVHDD